MRLPKHRIVSLSGRLKAEKGAVKKGRRINFVLFGASFLI